VSESLDGTAVKLVPIMSGLGSGMLVLIMSGLDHVGARLDHATHLAIYSGACLNYFVTARFNIGMIY
jgi:hypothetical protein